MRSEPIEVRARRSGAAEVENHRTRGSNQRPGLALRARLRSRAAG
jgi:hypothetical protein